MVKIPPCRRFYVFLYIALLLAAELFLLLIFFPLETPDETKTVSIISMHSPTLTSIGLEGKDEVSDTAKIIPANSAPDKSPLSVPGDNLFDIKPQIIAPMATAINEKPSPTEVGVSSFIATNVGTYVVTVIGQDLSGNTTIKAATIKTKDVTGLSLSTYIIYCIGMVSWISYGVYLHSIQMILFNAISLFGSNNIL